MVYLRESYSVIEFQSNPQTGEVRVLLTKLPPPNSARMLETLDQVTVNLVPPRDFRFGEPFEDEHWVGIQLVRKQPAKRAVDGFVSVMKTTKPPGQFSSSNNNSNSANSESMEPAGLDSEPLGTMEFFQ